MRYLSLFSGACGGDLGLQHLLGWNCCGYVEQDEYCCKVIEQRIKDGFLTDAPIFQGDIREWIKRGYARAYQGMVDCITAGFPCQPFSTAGKRLGAKDERNMWPATAEAISIVRPRNVFLENVPGIIRYVSVVRHDLRAMGYCVPPRAVVAAASVGAGHIRKRIWIRADSNSEGGLQQEGLDGEIGGWACHCPEEIPSDNYGNSTREQPGGVGRQGGAEEVQVSIDTQSKPNREQSDKVHSITDEGGARKKLVSGSWWESEPELERLVHGVPNRVDRDRALGNAQVPLVAAAAWRILVKESENE